MAFTLKLHMRIILSLIAVLGFAALAEGQDADPRNIWKTLSKITYTKEYDEVLGFKIDKPVFSQEIKDIEGEVVSVKGFIIPTEGYKSHKEFIFSAYPYSMCFFCGGAGPETVMEVTTTAPVQYTAEAITLRGKLRLNADDVNRLMYLLEEAELIETN